MGTMPLGLATDRVGLKADSPDPSGNPGACGQRTSQEAINPIDSARRTALAAGMPQRAQTSAVATTSTASAIKYLNANEFVLPVVLWPPIVSPGGVKREPDRIWRAARPAGRRLTAAARA